MNSRSNVAATAAALLTLAFGLSACGQPAEEAPATTTAEAAPAAETAAVPAAATTDTANVPTVGGAPMYPNKTIVENASQSADHTTLVTAVKAAGLVETLSGPGPFTVFAPTNAAFAKLPAGSVETLTQPANKEQLAGVLTYHVVPGRITADQLTDGQTLTTVNGGTLTVSKQGGAVTLTDAKGGKSTVTQADVLQSNGVVHVVDTVVMPS